MKKIAQLIADVVTVVCPSCGECQPNPEDGSQQWEPHHFQMKPVAACVSCDEQLQISWKSKVQFDAPAKEASAK